MALVQKGGGQGLQLLYIKVWKSNGIEFGWGLSRSHPALGEESDSDGDIEVPRFQSLDCGEDSDGDLEVERKCK